MMLGIKIGAAALAVGLAAGGGTAWRIQDWRYSAKEKERIEAQQELERENRRLANEAAAGHEADKESIRTEFVTITKTVNKIVEKPVYRNVCFDTDGLRELRRAIGSEGAAAGQSGAAVPESDGAR